MGAAKYAATRDKGLIDLRSPRNLSILNFSRASNGARYNSAGIMEQCWPNVARYDYDPMSVTRANLLKFSNDLTAPAPYWAFTNASGTATQVGNSFTFGSSAIDRILQAGVGVLVGQSYTATVRLSGSGSVRLFGLNGIGATVSPLAITLTSTPTDYSITFSNGAVGASGGLGIYNNAAGTAGASFTVHDAQFEKGASFTGYIKTGVLRRGAERLTNGDFSGGASGWTVTGTDGTHIITFSGGTMRYQSDTLAPILTISQPGALVAGRAYEIVTVCSAWTSGSIKIDTAESAAFSIAGGVGTTVKQFTATSTQLNIYRNSLNVDLTIDSISIREINTDFASPQGNARLRGLLVEQSSTNRFLRSDDMSHAIWAKSNVTVTANTMVAPDGTLTADKVEATTTAAATFYQEAVIPAASVAFSVYVKKGSGPSDGNIFLIRNTTTATNLVVISFNYDTGVITGAGAANTVLEYLPDGWIRLIQFATTGITAGDTIRGYVGFSGSAETAGEHFYAWGAQLESAEIPSSYNPTAATVTSRAIDIPRRQGGPAAIGYVDGPGTIYAEFAFAGRGSDGFPHNRTAVAIDDGSAADRIYIYNASGTVAGLVQAAGVTQAAPTVAGTLAPGVFSKAAFAYATDDFQSARDGTVSAVDNSGTLANPSMTDVWVGRAFGGVLNGWVRKIHYTPRRLDATTLGKMTT